MGVDDHAGYPAMMDGDDLRAEFARYLTEHRHTRWGLDAALLHVCRVAYEAGAADERAGTTAWVTTPNFQPKERADGTDQFAADQAGAARTAAPNNETVRVGHADPAHGQPDPVSAAYAAAFKDAGLAGRHRASDVRPIHPSIRPDLHVGIRAPAPDIPEALRAPHWLWRDIQRGWRDSGVVFWVCYTLMLLIGVYFGVGNLVRAF